jgi:Ca2+-dependent lipid-binding protein
MYLIDKYVLYVQPHLDFGLNLLGGDIMAIPGLYQYVQVLSLLSLNSHIL